MRGASVGEIFDLRFPVKSEAGRVTLLEKDQVFYVEAEQHSTGSLNLATDLQVDESLPE